MSITYEVRVHHDGLIEWRLNSQLHRADGPAIEHPNNSRLWYRDGKLHRVGKPAMVMANGLRKWFCDGQLHRIDGYAVYGESNEEQYWVRGHYCKTKEYYNMTLVACGYKKREDVPENLCVLSTLIG